MSCRRATELISARLDRPLKVRERVSLRWHLLVCTGCRRYQTQMIWLRMTLSAFATRLDVAAEKLDAPLPAEARARIRETLRRE